MQQDVSTTVEQPIRQRKEKLVQVGSRIVSSDARIHPWEMAKWLVEHHRKRYATVKDLAKMWCGSATKDNQRRVRGSLSQVNACLLEEYNEFLLYETERLRRIYRVKILDTKDPKECDAARFQLERMRRSREVSSQKYEKALQVIGLLKVAVEPWPQSAAIS